MRISVGGSYYSRCGGRSITKPRITEESKKNFLENIRSFYDTNVIKLIRVDLQQDTDFSLKNFLEKEISPRSKNIIYLNLKYSDVKTKEQLLDYVKKNRKQGMCFVFLEDIKLFDEWQEACLALKEENCSVFVKVNKRQMISVKANENMTDEYMLFIYDRYSYWE